MGNRASLPPAGGEPKQAAMEDVVTRLDLIVRLLRLSNAELIAEARKSILGDAVSQEIYDRSESWRPAGALISEVADAADVASRTVNRRLSEMVAKGVLETSGASTGLRYRHVPQF